MWLWSKIADLRVELAEKRAALVAVERERDRLQHEHDLLRMEYGNLVQTLNAMAHRPTGRTLFEGDDPYSEKKEQPDEWLTPAEDELGINVTAIEDKLSGDNDDQHGN